LSLGLFSTCLCHSMELKMLNARMDLPGGD
jgi:hypothetical protein